MTEKIPLSEWDGHKSVTKGRQIERVMGNCADGLSAVIFLKPNCNYNLLLRDG